MAMILKRLNVSTDVKITHRTNGMVTGTTVHSEPGMRADLLLISNDQFQTEGSPTYASVTVEFDVDRVPDLDGIEEWIRTKLIDMLQRPEVEED